MKLFSSIVYSIAAVTLMAASAQAAVPNQSILEHDFEENCKLSSTTSFNVVQTKCKNNTCAITLYLRSCAKPEEVLNVSGSLELKSSFNNRVSMGATERIRPRYLGDHLYKFSFKGFGPVKAAYLLLVKVKDKYAKAESYLSGTVPARK